MANSCPEFFDSQPVRSEHDFTGYSEGRQPLCIYCSCSESDYNRRARTAEERITRPLPVHDWDCRSAQMGDLCDCTKTGKEYAEMPKHAGIANIKKYDEVCTENVKLKEQIAELIEADRGLRDWE